MGFLPVMKQGNIVRETFVCRSFTCCRNWEGTVSTAGNGRKDDHDEGSWVLEDWVSCHAIQANSILCLMIIWVFLILWITDLKLSDLICCVTEHSDAFVYWMWKSSTYCCLYWQNDSVSQAEPPTAAADTLLLVSVLHSFSVIWIQCHPFSFNLSMVQKKSECSWNVQIQQQWEA